MAWEARSGLKLLKHIMSVGSKARLNGLGSPFGIETNVFWIMSWLADRG